jgi:hypothetical protein
MPQFDLSKYDTVADRVKRFRQEHPQGAIYVRIVPEVSTFEQVVCEAEVWFNLSDLRPSGKDIAAEWKGENYKAGANFTAWHENAATSAIGRALDAAGYSKNKETGSRATQEEMQKAERVAGNPTQDTTRPGQVANAQPLTVVEGGAEETPVTAWEQLKIRADEFGFTSDDTRDYVFLTYELCKGVEIKGEERYLYAAGENAVAWETAIEALKARRQQNSQKAVAQ